MPRESLSLSPLVSKPFLLPLTTTHERKTLQLLDIVALLYVHSHFAFFLILSFFYVQEESRLTALESPLQQKFLVGKVPCLLRFQWDNGYSWLREKLVSYKVSVRPPTRDSIRLSRRRRAQACLEDVRKEWTELTNELVPAIQATTTSLQEQMTELWKQYTEIKQQYEEAKQEQERLLGRKQVREEQERLLKQRLEQGWDDENAQPDHRANGK